jgi:UPF0176 protein
MDADARPYTTISFYCYHPISDSESFRNDLFLRFYQHEVVGRIYVAQEGINAQLALPSIHFEAFKAAVYTIDFLKGIRLNIAIEEKQKSFIKLDIKVRAKIVADGIEDPTFSLQNSGKYLDAAAWNEMMEKPDSVVIDMRNHYESEVGRFEGASCPDTDTFREELARVLDLYKEEKDKPILMYCTGGIRCEKASAWMKHNGYNEVYHLEGGIINYVNQVKAASLDNKFRGVNFVFDQRLAERVTEDVIAQCHQCGEPADKHINCANTGCHLLFIQCDACAAKFEHCCSEECKAVIHLDAETQVQLRKGKPPGRIFSKGRFPGKV